jgi:hypothetical protein
MNDVPQFDVTLSYVALLLEEQRYEEALPILGTLMDMDPSDREARMYRLLVLRILVQRYYLSNPRFASPSQPHRIAKKLLATLAAESADRLRSLGKLCRAMQPLVVNAVMNRLTLTAAACGVLVTPLVFYMAGGHVGMHRQSRPLFIGAAHLILSAVDLKGYNLKSTTAPEMEAVTTAAWDVSELLPEPTNLNLPVISWTEIVPAQSIAKLESREFRADVTYPMTYSERRTVPKRRDVGSTPTIHKKKIAAKETGASKTRKQTLAQYQSKRTVPIRESASFAAAVVQEIARGTLVSVVEVRGSWAKIEVGDPGVSGFIRKEFLMPVNLGRAA